MSILSIIQLFIPIITFAMGYFLANIVYQRDRKLNIVREKFEKLYHPFYLLLHQIGAETGDGETLVIGGENEEDHMVFKPFFDHLTANIYPASPKGQKLYMDARKLFVGCCTLENNDEEKGRLLGLSFGVLCDHLLEEYVKCAKTLGYEISSD